MKRAYHLLFVIVIMAMVVGCGSATSESDSVSESKTGNLTIQMTDAPFPSGSVAEANVTINRIEIRRSDESEGNPFVELPFTAQPFNLLALTNGVTASLVDVEISPGSYDLIRLYVAEAGIVLSDAREFSLAVPGGSETGIKIFIEPEIIVAGGLTTDLLLDFDVSSSFVVQGNPDTAAGIKGFLFKPTLKAVNLSTSGSLSGAITDESELPVSDALVSVYSSGALYTATFSDANGEYTVLGLPAGIYDILVESGGYSAAPFDDLDIVKGNETVLDVQLIKL